MLKLSKNQLRSLVNDVVKQRITESRINEIGSSDTIVEQFGLALQQLLEERIFTDEDLSYGLEQKISDLLSPDEVTVPANYEEVRSLARACTDYAFENIRSDIEEAVFNVLQMFIQSR
ncbi:MAG: hypothetical protein WCT13_05545 [Patescibacteria group bacterium]|jgi:hypothetical protein